MTLRKEVKAAIRQPHGNNQMKALDAAPFICWLHAYKREGLLVLISLLIHACVKEVETAGLISARHKREREHKLVRICTREGRADVHPKSERRYLVDCSSRERS